MVLLVKTARITAEDIEAAKEVVEVEEGTYAVPSISQTLPNGDPLTRVVNATGDTRGRLTFSCDCEAGALAYKRVVCRHVRAVVAFLRMRAEA